MTNFQNILKFYSNITILFDAFKNIIWEGYTRLPEGGQGSTKVKSLWSGRSLGRLLWPVTPLKWMKKVIGYIPMYIILERWLLTFNKNSKIAKHWTSDSQWGVIFPPNGDLPISTVSLVVTIGRCYLAFTGWRTGMLLNILHIRNCPLQKTSYPAQCPKCQ